MNDVVTPQNVVSVVVGCDPQVNVRITETDSGTLFVVIEPVDFDKPLADIDGIFFDLADGSSLDALNFFPEANQGSIFSPVTSIQAAADSVNTLSNGAQVAESYDIGIQFGTTDDSTAGDVNQANFTLFGDNGPLSIEDLDLSSLTVVVDSDGGNGQVLTTGDAPDADPVFVSTEVLFEDFDDIHTPTDSAAVESNDGWIAAYDRLVTNGHEDGTVTFTEVATDGPVTLTMDLTTHNTHVFENSGHYADSLRVEVQIDGGNWVLLDEYQVNDAGTLLVGSETGQSFDASGNTVTYSGGILDTATSDVQFRVVSDISAGDEVIKIDNLSITATQEVDGAAETVLMTEDFSDIHDPAQSENIMRDGGWDVRNGELATDGHNDGYLRFEPIEANGDVSLSFDARVGDASLFEATGHYADSVRLQVRNDDGTWNTIDNFVVNDSGTALVGNQSGNEITEGGSTLSYSGGQLDDVSGNFEFRLVSDISAGDEQVFFDNFTVTQAGADGGHSTTDCPPVTEGFEGLASGDIVSDQFAGVTVSAQRAGDDENSANDAMIFDTNAPTGGDHDLEYTGQGNAIIISEDGDSSDADDNAHGGTISFEFETVSEVTSLNLLDIEEAGGTIDLFDDAGELIRTVDIPAAGDNSEQLISIDTAGVSSMDVNLVGSGAVDDLTYVPDCECEGQYDADYVGGLPILFPVEPKDEDEAEDEVLMDV